MAKEYLIEKILKLKEKYRAVFLVHNYQIPEVQDIADFLGDSLGLSEQARDTDADVIIFCGVHFMAETAAILNPGKTVILPDPDAGCPMADMITAPELIQFKSRHPGLPVVAYVNTTAAVKAESDIACTSANAENVLASLPDDEVIFIPDKYLAHNAGKKSGKRVAAWNGYCPVHVLIQPEDIERSRREHPDAEVIVHPECTPEVVERADRSLSTGGMIRGIRESASREFIVGTEVGILYRLRKEYPDREFFPATEKAVCPNMKKINLEKILWSLEDLTNVIRVDPGIRKKAWITIDRMLAAGSVKIPGQ